LQELEKKAEKELYKIELVQRFIGSGRLLEIGPAYGGFAYLAKKAGFEVEAIEMDANCCRFLTETVGVTCIKSADIPSALQGVSPYNVIVLWHVIEHLAETDTIVKVLSEHLLKGGILLIAAPNPESFQFKLFGRYWVHVDAPRHLRLIPKKILIEQMMCYGLEPVEFSTKDEASVIFNTFEWFFVSFGNVFHRIKAKRRIRLYKEAKHELSAEQNMEPMSGFGGVLTLLLKAIGLVVRNVSWLVFFLIIKRIQLIEGLGSAFTIVGKKR
jgi:predicted SAM-dependent methyltransferase